jgi:tetratricopeptide (TPR) repeat protein
MTQEAATFKPENAKTYEALISLIENSQGRLAPIVVGCDDEILRDKVIDRYEAEAKVAQIAAYRITLGSEPNISAGLARLKASETYLQGNGEAVFTVTGAEFLLWIKTHEEDAQSELDKFFGYLQWTREALRKYPYPIVIWVPHRILRQMSQRAPDFWSWRKAVLRFVDEEAVSAVAVDFDRSERVEISSEDPFLPPLEELLEEIQQIESQSADSASLATLYDKLGQVYAWRVTHGKAKDLAQEQKAAIKAFEQAIANQKSRQNETALIDTLNRLGDFLYSQLRLKEAVATHQQSLELSQKIQDKQREAMSLGNLEMTFDALNESQRIINFHQQSLDIKCDIGDKKGKTNSFDNPGNADNDISMSQFIAAILLLPVDARERQRKIGEFVRLVQSSGRLWRPPGVNHDLYHEVLSDLWVYIFENFHKYDPSRGSVMSWINNRLKWNLKTKQLQHWEKLQRQLLDRHDRANIAEVADTYHADIAEVAKHWWENRSLSQAIHIRHRPDLNCYEFFQDMIGLSCEPDKWLEQRDRSSYRAMSEYYQVPLPTIASFWVNNCLPFIRQLFQYIDVDQQLKT